MDSTKDYSIFTLRKDNRKIDTGHLNKLIKSIESKNMLDLRPILVNSDYEVIDGQHRLHAAKFLSVPIFYQIQEDSSANEMRLMNISKAWCLFDYLNFYVKNGYGHYVRFDNFCKKHNLNFWVVLSLSQNLYKNEKTKSLRTKFKEGNFIFEEDRVKQNFDVCHETVSMIRKLKGPCSFTQSSKFWTSLNDISNHENFDKKRWLKNLERFIDKMTPKVCYHDYLRLFMEIYNWKSESRIEMGN